MSMYLYWYFLSVAILCMFGSVKVLSPLHDWSLNRPYTPTGVAADIIINLVWGGKVRTDCIVAVATLLFT